MLGLVFELIKEVVNLSLTGIMFRFDLASILLDKFVSGKGVDRLPLDAVDPVYICLLFALLLKFLFDLASEINLSLNVGFRPLGPESDYQLLLGVLAMLYNLILLVLELDAVHLDGIEAPGV